MADDFMLSVSRMMRRSALALCAVALAGSTAWMMQQRKVTDVHDALIQQVPKVVPQLKAADAMSIVITPDQTHWQHHPLIHETWPQTDGDIVRSVAILYAPTASQPLTIQSKQAIEGLANAGVMALDMRCHDRQLALSPVGLISRRNTIWQQVEQWLSDAGCTMDTPPHAQWRSWQNQQWVLRADKSEPDFWRQGDVLRQVPSAKTLAAFQLLLEEWLRRHRKPDGNWPERYDALTDRISGKANKQVSQQATMILAGTPLKAEPLFADEGTARKLVQCQITDAASGTAQGSFGDSTCPSASFSPLMTARHLHLLVDTLYRQQRLGEEDEAIRRAIRLALRHLIQGGIDQRNSFYLKHPSAARGGIKLLPAWPMVSTEAVVEAYLAVAAVQRLSATENARGEQHTR